MNSPLLSTSTTLLMPLLLVYSINLLLSGHNLPGGGFTGGLIASAAFALYAVAHDVRRARHALRVPPRLLIATGLIVAAASGFIGMAAGHPYLTGVWLEGAIPTVGKVGTPLVFDIGVYLVVLGVTLQFIFALAEED